MKKKYKNNNILCGFIHDVKDYECLRDIAINSSTSTLLNNFCQVGMAIWLVKMSDNNENCSNNLIGTFNNEIVNIVANMI